MRTDCSEEERTICICDMNRFATSFVTWQSTSRALHNTHKARESSENTGENRFARCARRRPRSARPWEPGAPRTPNRPAAFHTRRQRLRTAPVRGQDAARRFRVSAVAGAPSAKIWPDRHALTMSANLISFGWLAALPIRKETVRGPSVAGFSWFCDAERSRERSNVTYLEATCEAAYTVRDVSRSWPGS